MKNIRVIVKSGNSVGKNIVVLAGVHGNEVCGIKAFDDLIPIITIKRGKVTFIYSNLKAQSLNKRFVETNLNRCFLDDQPKSIVKTLEGRTAKEIIKYLREADALLDIHSSNSSGNDPFLICEEDCANLIKCLRPRKALIGIDRVHKGSTNGYMHNLGKIGVCIECGKHNSEGSVKMAKESILNFLRYFGILEGTQKTYPMKEFYKVKAIYINKHGAFKFKIKNASGEFYELSKKTLIGLDGNKKVFAEKNQVIIFPHDRKETGKECFLVLGSCPWH